jgi:four helix bundle protein
MNSGVEMVNLSDRTKSFALRIIRVFASLPKDAVAQVIGKQLLRSGTSVGAHYREAKRARTNAEFISKMEGGQQELEESLYWLELLVEANIISEKKLQPLMNEADELMAIWIASVKKAKSLPKKKK